MLMTFTKCVKSVGAITTPGEQLENLFEVNETEELKRCLGIDFVQ